MSLLGSLKSLNFLHAFASHKVKDAVKSTVDALVAFDPKGATEAQISLMEDQLDALGTRVAATQQEHTEACQQLDAAKTLRQQRLTAAETLEKQIAAGDDSKKRSLDTLLKILEDAQPELDALETERNDTKAFLSDLRTAYDEAAAKLKGARAELAKAERDMTRAATSRERAEQRADAALVAAGVHSGNDTLNTALDAMRRKAAEANVAAEASNLKATSLAPQDHEASDPNIAAAMNAAAGKPASTQTASERLAALKSKAA